MNSISILIIEDNPQDIRLIREYLDEAHQFTYQLHTAGTLKESCELIDKNVFDIILLDLSLPDSTGYRTFTSILGRCGSTPLVLVSGYNDEELSVKLIKEGAQDYIAKNTLSTVLLEKTILYSIERRKAELELVSAREMFRMIAENTSDNIVVLDLNLRTEYVSPSVTKLRGFTVQEAMAQKLEEVFPAESLQKITNLFENIVKLEASGNLSAGSVFNLEVELFHKNGNTIWAELTPSFIRDKNGKPTGIVCLAKDITKRKRIQEDLHKSQEKYSKAFMTSPYAITITRLKDAGFIEVNDAFTKITGYSKEEAITGSSVGLELWEDINDRKRIISDLVNGKNVLSEEIHFRIKNGNIITCLFSEQLININGEQIILSSINDISARKRSEELLRDSEMQLDNAQEIAKMGNWEYNFHDKKLIWSKNFYRFFGYEPYSIEPTYELFHSKVHPDDRNKIKFFDEMFSENETIITEMRFVVQDGITKWLQTKVVPVFKGADLVGLKGVSSDITDRKLAEELVIQTRINYETFFNTIDDFLFVLDNEGNIIHINDTVIQRLGYTKEELFGLSVLVIHPPDRREEAGRIVNEMLNGKADFCPVPLISKSGVRFPVETKVSYGIWDGKPAIFGVSKDVSKIRLSEEKFSKLFYINPSACGLSDLENQNYLEVNEAFYSLLGFDHDEVIGKSATELNILSENERDSILRKSDTKGNTYNIEADLRAKNGDIKHVLLSAEIIEIQNKKYRFTIVHDITEIKQAEQKLRISEHNLAEAERVGNTGNWVYDYSTDKNVWSDNMSRILGAGDEAKKTNNFLFFIENIVHPDDRAKLVSAYFNPLPGKYAYDYECRIIRNDGELRHIHILAENILDVEGNIIRLVGRVEDITERKRAEYSLLESEARYRRVTEEISDVVWNCDLNMNVTFISPSYKKLIGETYETAMTRTFEERFPPGTMNRFMSIIIEELENEKNRKADKNRFRTIEVEHYNIDGSVIWMEFRASFMRDSDGNVVGIQGVTRNITDRKQAEMSLRQSEEKYKTIFENVAEGIYQSTPAGKYISANPSLAKMLGFNSPEELTEKISDLSNEIYANPADRKKILFMLENENVVKDFETQLKRADGTILWTLVNARTIRDKDGKILYFEGTNTDITQRRMMENTLRENEEMYRSLMENLPVIIARFDKDLKHLFINSTIESISGIDPSEFIGKRMDEVGMPEVNVGKWNNVLEQVFFTGKSETFDFEIPAAGNKCIYLSANAVPEFNNNGQVDSVLCVIKDVTEQKLAERTIIDSELKFRTLYEKSPVPYQSVDENTVIIDVNPAWLKTLGYEKEEVIRKTFPNFLTEKSKERYDDIFLNMKAKGILHNIEFDFVSKSGEIINALFEGVYADGPEGSLKRTYTTFKNITQEKHFDKIITNAIIDSEENQRAMFAQELHDGLGPMLSSIKLFLKSIEKRNNIETVYRVIGEINAIIDESIIMLKELSHNLSPHILSNHGLNPAINDFLNRIKGIDIEMNFESNFTGRYGNAIETGVYRVITELVHNTVKHAEATRISIILLKTENVLNIRYSDNGHGFDVASMLKSSKGSGLYNIINRMKALDATHRFTSDYGQGFSFNATINLNNYD